MKRKSLRSLVLAASGAAVLATLNLAALLSPQQRTEYAPGDMATRDIYAPVRFPLPKDSSVLRAEQDSAAALVVPVLVMNREVEAGWRQTLRRMRASDSATDVLPWEKRDLLNAKLFAVADTILARIGSQGYCREKEDLRADRVVVLMGETETHESIANILGFWDTDTLIENSVRRRFSGERAVLLMDMLRRIVLPNPNLIYDAEEVAARREEARRGIDPNKGYVERGELIAAADEPMDERTVEKIAALNAQMEGDWRVKLRRFVQRNLLFALILALLVVAVYLLRREPGMEELLFVTSLLVVGLAASFALRRFSAWWFVPTGFAALAVAMFLGPLEGVLIAGTASLLCYVSWPEGGAAYLVYALASGFSALMGLHLMHRRAGFAAVLGFVLAGGVLGRVGFLLARSDLAFRELALMGMDAGINSLLNFAFLVASFFAAERLFGFTSTLTLAGLADLNRPLFKRFALKAPGTYHHSILVGNLAERAARVTGANPALALAGGYYHDIGKMTKPQYFIENQLEGENPHDALKPRMSALILINHVKEGLALAERYRLPRAIRGIIAQHQGTTRMEYFYRKHQEAEGTENVPEEDFRYPGPKPQTKEAALVMLADSVEAAVRAQGFKDRDELAELIKRVVNEKVADGQLDECPFTTADIHKVQEAFTSLLVGAFHPRIRYEKDNDRSPNRKNPQKTSPAKARKKRS